MMDAVPDRRLKVAQIIQQAFFPWPPTQWRTMSPNQQEEFLECADEILSFLALSSLGGEP